MNKKKVYISLPISGRDMEEVKIDIEKAKVALAFLGATPVSPLEVYPDPDASYEEHIGKDITALLQCDAVAFLDGWKQSKGCRLEYQAAKIYGIDVLYIGGLIRKTK